jgi:capsid protein
LKTARAKSKPVKRFSARRSSPRDREAEAFLQFFNLHSAARPSPDRSTLPTTWQDAARDATPAERIALARKARVLDAESPLVAGIINRIVTLVVGTGLNPEPATGDDVYDQEASAAWDEFSLAADITGMHSMGQLQRLAFRGKFINGDHFGLKCEDETGAPKVQLLESHRVASETSMDPLDGLTLDKYGRVDKYRVCLEAVSSHAAMRTGAYEMVDAADMVHFRYQTRAGEYRPMTAMKAALNFAHDITDILALEKNAVKDACSKTDVIETQTGEANPVGKTMQRFELERPQAVTGAAASQLFYEKIFGARAKYIRRGDKYTPYVPQRPSPAWQGYMDFLAALICLPSGFPPSILLQIKVGGVDSRRDLASAARVIQVLQFDFASELHPIYTFAIDKKLGVGGRPKNWQRAEWHGPRSITGDAGKQSKEDRLDISMGVLSIQEYCASQETSMRKLFRQNAKAKKERAKIAEEEQVAPDDVFNFNPNPNGQPIEAAPAPDPNPPTE